MSYEHKDNRGSLWENDRKSDEKHSDYSGDANLRCPHCNAVTPVWINGWMKNGRSGSYFTLSFKPKGGGARKPQSEPGDDWPPT